jgi:hypothetical protein
MKLLFLLGEAQRIHTEGRRDLGDRGESFGGGKGFRFEERSTVKDRDVIHFGC